jgi:EpsI family protein
MDIGGVPVPVGAARVRSSDGRVVEARQWYWIDGTLTSSDALAKVRIALSRLMGRGDDSAVVVVYTRADGTAQPGEVLQNFVKESWPAIAASLSQAKEGRQ